MGAEIWTFIAVHFWGVIGSLSGLALILAIVAVVCFGWQIGTVLTAFLNFARTVIAFFETPFGEVVGILMLLAVVWFASDIRRTRIDEAAYQAKLTAALNAAAKTAAEDRAARDDYVKQQVGADADKRVADIHAEKQALEQKANDDEAALKNSPNAPCVVGPDDLAGSVPNGRHK